MTCRISSTEIQEFQIFSFSRKGEGITDYSILTAVPAAVTMSMLPLEPIAS